MSDRVRSAPTPLTTDELAFAFSEALASSDTDDHAFALGELLKLLVARDPEKAAALVVDIADESLRMRAIDGVARLWADRDRVAALKWADALPFADERAGAVTSICLHPSLEPASHAVVALAGYLPGDHPVAGLDDLTQRWAENDVEPASVWVLDNPPGPRRESLIARLAFVQSKATPAKAAELVATELPPGQIHDEATIAILHQWARRDNAGAAAWVDRMPPGPLRERARRELQTVSGQ